MDRKLLSLPVFTIALAVAFVFWAPGGSMAAGSSYHPGYNESANTFEDNDWAGTRAETIHFVIECTLAVVKPKPIPSRITALEVIQASHT